MVKNARLEFHGLSEGNKGTNLTLLCGAGVGELRLKTKLNTRETNLNFTLHPLKKRNSTSDSNTFGINERETKMTDKEYNLRSKYHRLEGYAEAINDYGIWKNGEQTIGCMGKRVKEINCRINKEMETLWDEIELVGKSSSNTLFDL